MKTKCKHKVESKWGKKRSLNQTAVPQGDIYSVTTEFCIVEVYMALYGILHICLIISTRDKLCNSADKLLYRGRQAVKSSQCRKYTRLKKVSSLMDGYPSCFLRMSQPPLVLCPSTSLSCKFPTLFSQILFRLLLQKGSEHSVFCHHSG